MVLAGNANAARSNDIPTEKRFTAKHQNEFALSFFGLCKTILHLSLSPSLPFSLSLSLPFSLSLFLSFFPCHERFRGGNLAITREIVRESQPLSWLEREKREGKRIQS